MKIKTRLGKFNEYNVSRQTRLLNDYMFHYMTGEGIENSDMFRAIKDAQNISLSGFEITQLLMEFATMTYQENLKNINYHLTPHFKQFNEGLITEHELLNKLIPDMIKNGITIG